MGSPTRKLADELVAKCDKCKSAPGVGFTDYWWLCEKCRQKYLDGLPEKL